MPTKPHPIHNLLSIIPASQSILCTTRRADLDRPQATTLPRSPPYTMSAGLSSIPERGGRRPYDLVVVGASGFVGQLLTQHLLRTYALGSPPTHSGFRLALSAHSKERLARAQQELAHQEPDQGAATRALAEVPVLWGDVEDPEFAEAVAGQARVVAASLSPYSKHSAKLVEACVEKGLHYVDIMGEMLWMRESIERHHHPAERKGVHACGLGSVPADLSAFPRSSSSSWGPSTGEADGWIADPSTHILFVSNNKWQSPQQLPRRRIHAELRHAHRHGQERRPDQGDARPALPGGAGAGRAHSPR